MNGKKIYKLCVSQSQLLGTALFSLEPKKAVQENLVAFGLFAENDFNADAMEKALNCLIQRNDALRLRICLRPFGLRQYISEYEPYTPRRIRIADRQEFERMVSASDDSIPLFSPRLIQATIAECADGTSGGIYLVCHHFCSDGYSIALMHDRLETYYKAYCAGEEPDAEKEYSITQYFLAEEKYRKGKQHKEDRKWWAYAYNHQPRYRFPAGRLPIRCTLNTQEALLEGEDYRALKQYCGDHDLSFTAALTTLGALTVYCLSGADNFGLYTLVHGRNTLPLRRTIGCMPNSVPIFYDIDVTLSAEEYLDQAYPVYLETLSHARFPAIEQVPLAIKETYIKHFGYNHMWFLFSIMDYMDTKEDAQLEMIASGVDYTMGIIYCALLNESSHERLHVQLNYQIKCFSAEQVQRMLDAFRYVVRHICREPQIPVSELRKAVLADLNKR